MSNVLIIGCDGKIGAALYRYLSTDTVVYGTTRRMLTEISSRIFHLDLAASPNTWEIPDVAFTTVYLCAAVSNMAFCEDNPEASTRINVTAMQALVRYFSERNTRIVFLSTNQVFSGEAPHVAIDATRTPRNAYGRQKALVEAFIEAHCDNYAIVRLTKVITPFATPFQDWITALRQEQPIDAFHDMVVAPISLSYVVAMLSRIGRDAPSGCYHLSGPEDVTYYQLGCYFAERLGSSRTLVTPVSALDKGIRIIFLPPFTSLQISSILALNQDTPSHYTDVIDANFEW